MTTRLLAVGSVAEILAGLAVAVLQDITTLLSARDTVVDKHLLRVQRPATAAPIRMCEGRLSAHSMSQQAMRCLHFLHVSGAAQDAFDNDATDPFPMFAEFRKALAQGRPS